MTAGYDSHYRRYDRIYNAFFQAQIPLVGLLEKTKQIYNTSAQSSVLTSLYQVEAAMDAGLNLGAVTHQKSLQNINPMGFWDLDIDGPEHGLDLSPFNYRVRRTNEPVKAHYLARLPDPTVPLETSYKGKDYDICTWNTVMPGSVHTTGTVYELEYLENGEWVLWDGEDFTVDMLPIVDPAKYRALKGEPTPKPSKEIRPFQGNKKAANKPLVWITATGSYESRTKMARDYLRYYAWRSISGMNGHDALLVVVTNLRLFHRLEKPLALSMLREHYNPRCIDLQGAPCPWSDTELLHKWEEAGGAEAYPTLGADNARTRAKEAALTLKREVAEFLRQFTQEGGRSNPSDLRRAFIAHRCGEDVNATAFGRAVSEVTGLKTTTPNGKRVYQGFSLTEAGLGFTSSSGRECCAA